MPRVIRSLQPFSLRDLQAVGIAPTGGPNFKIRSDN